MFKKIKDNKINISVLWVVLGFSFFGIWDYFGLINIWLIVSVFIVLPILILEVRKNK